MVKNPMVYAVIDNHLQVYGRVSGYSSGGNMVRSIWKEEMIGSDVQILRLSYHS